MASRLNLKALASAAGGRRAELADPAKAQRATGYVLGGISPLGHRSAIPVLVDSSATGFDTVFVSAGKRGLQVELAPADLLRLTGADAPPRSLRPEVLLAVLPRRPLLASAVLGAAAGPPGGSCR